MQTLKVIFTSNWDEIKRKSLSNSWIVFTLLENPHERWIATYANLIEKRSLFHHISTTDIKTVIKGLDHGLPTKTIDRVVDLIGVTRADLSQIIDVSPRTLSRRETLKATASERLFRVSALFQKTLEVLEDKKEAQRWFTTPKKALGGKTPLAFSETEVGAREVEDFIGRVEYGVYA